MSLAEATPILRAHHYLGQRGRRPADPVAVFGWMDRGRTVAVIVYTSPAARAWSGALELSRLARVPDLTDQLSQFIAQSLRWLKRNTGYAYVVSYADIAERHYGGIYQAANFTYFGEAGGGAEWWSPETGKTCSRRAFDQRSPDNRVGWVRRKSSKKYLYVYPLKMTVDEIEKASGKTRAPYPKPDAM